MPRPSAVSAPPTDLPRRTRPRRNWLTPALAFAVCVLLVEAVFGDSGVAGLLNARREYRELSAGLARVTEENAGLREQARRLHEDPAMIEQIARQELGLIRPGEILVVLEDLK